LETEEQRKTPTDAKRPAGVISLIGGYEGTPSLRSFELTGGYALCKVPANFPAAIWAGRDTYVPFRSA
jgi:20S proteasome alpha/beta subunit